MTEYKVELDRILKKDVEGKAKTEIWAKILNLDTKEQTETLIFWQDEQGVFHDETPNIPADMRDAVDNAWIEKRRIW